MAAAHPQTELPRRLRFGRFELRPFERLLLHDGEQAQLGARAFDLLLALVLNPGRLLTKGQLLDLAWPGLVVEEANIQVQVSTLRKLIGPGAITTIPGIGYRFSAVLEAQSEPTSAAGTGDAGVAASSESLSLPNRPSVAVLPFANLSADADQEYFADGVTEDIITQLSRFQSLFVIARNSSFAYRHKAMDMRQVGRDLGVRYVVEGSIRRWSNRVRLNARLIDSLSGNHIWADTYDRVLEDIFAVQEEVTACVVAAVAPSVDVAENLRVGRRPRSVSAYEMAIRARALILREWQESDRTKGEEGLQLARSALRVDPDSVIALTAIASAQFHGVYLRTAANREAAWQEGMAAVERAISLANAGHATKALLLLQAPSGSRIDEALVEAQTAVRINPQDSTALAICGHVTVDAGDPVEAIRLLERSVRINPRDPFGYNTYAGLAQCCLFTREYRKGVEWAMRSHGQASGHALTQLMLAALLVGLGELDQAKAAMEVARRLAPDWVRSRLEGQAAIREGANRQHFITFIRVAAGLEPPEAAQALR